MIYVNYTSICTNSYHDGEQYGDWSEDWDFYVDDVSLRAKGSSYDKYPIEAEVGDTIYVLYVRYSDGDSFGHASGKGMIVYASEDLDEITRLRDAYEDNVKDDYCVSFEFETSHGTLRVSVENDYFGGHDSSEIKSFIVQV